MENSPPTKAPVGCRGNLIGVGVGLWLCAGRASSRLLLALLSRAASQTWPSLCNETLHGWGEAPEEEGGLGSLMAGVVRATLQPLQ